MITNKELADLLDRVASVLQLESFYDLASKSSAAAQSLREAREWEGWASSVSSAGDRCPFVNGTRTGGDFRVRVTEIIEAKENGK